MFLVVFLLSVCKQHFLKVMNLIRCNFMEGSGLGIFEHVWLDLCVFISRIAVDIRLNVNWGCQSWRVKESTFSTLNVLWSLISTADSPWRFCSFICFHPFFLRECTYLHRYIYRQTKRKPVVQKKGKIGQTYLGIIHVTVVKALQYFLSQILQMRWPVILDVVMWRYANLVSNWTYYF